jgi:hypothetical protein
MAGTSSSDADPVGRGADVDDDDDTSPLLDLLQKFPELGVVKELHNLSAAAGTSSAVEGATKGGSAAGGVHPRLSTGGPIPAPRVAVEPPAPPPDLMTPAAQGDPAPPSVLLVPLLEHLRDFFRTEVLRRLGATDLASLAGVGHGFAAAVASTALMQWAEHAKPPRATRGFPALGTLRSEGACSHAARDGNLEVLQWLHTTGCPLDGAVTMCGPLMAGTWRW